MQRAHGFSFSLRVVPKSEPKAKSENRQNSRSKTVKLP